MFKICQVDVFEDVQDMPSSRVSGCSRDAKQMCLRMFKICQVVVCLGVQEMPSRCV